MIVTEIKPKDFLDDLEDIFTVRGAEEYLGEAVSMAEHMIQTALNAERDGADDALIAACLLHDIGHFVDPAPDASDWHRHHDEAGAAFLADHFGPDVTQPTRLHVDAKRYLCAVEPDYFDRLSPASVLTLEKQGGPMNEEEIQAFEANPFHKDACCLRRWEEEGKKTDIDCPDFASFRPLLERVRT